jgi:hypothetical protein
VSLESPNDANAVSGRNYYHFCHKSVAITTSKANKRIAVYGGTVEVVPAWRFLLSLPHEAE